MKAMEVTQLGFNPCQALSEGGSQTSDSDFSPPDLSGPSQARLIPSWDLGIVLKALTEPPFEP